MKRQRESWLTRLSVLCVFNPYPFNKKLHMNASAVRLSAVLMQRQDGGSMKAIALYGRKTPYEESRYHLYELECLVIIEA